MLRKVEKDELFEKMVSGVRDEFKNKPAESSHSNKKRPALGKGLSSLMGLSEVSIEEPVKELETAEVEAEPAKIVSQNEAGVQFMDVSKIIANPNQPRKHFAEEELKGLSESIKQSGLIQPIVLREASEGVFEIVAGERRFRAAKLAGLERVPVLVKELDERQTLEISIVENVQRSDLSPVEEALAYKRLADEFGLSQQEIAETVAKDRVSISNTMRLLSLEPEILELIERGQLTAGHGRALLMKDPGKERLVLALKVVKEALSVRATEKLARNEAKAKKPSQQNTEYAEVEQLLRRSLGTKVKLQVSSTGKSGEIRLSFFSREELEGLIEKLS